MAKLWTRSARIKAGDLLRTTSNRTLYYVDAVREIKRRNPDAEQRFELQVTREENKDVLALDRLCQAAQDDGHRVHWWIWDKRAAKS